MHENLTFICPSKVGKAQHGLQNHFTQLFYIYIDTHISYVFAEINALICLYTLVYVLRITLYTYTHLRKHIYN